MMIDNQPPGGKASFQQIPSGGCPDPLTKIDFTIAPHSSVSRSVFVTSTDRRARINISVREIAAPTPGVCPSTSVPLLGGLQTSIVLNADLTNTDLTNTDLTNGDILSSEAYNTDLTNATLTVTDLTNTDLTNTDLTNTDL